MHNSIVNMIITYVIDLVHLGSIIFIYLFIYLFIHLFLYIFLLDKSNQTISSRKFYFPLIWPNVFTDRLDNA